MLYFQQLILFAFPAFLVCSATKVLPRAAHAAADSEALVELRNVMVRARNHAGARNAAIHRRWLEASTPVRDARNESPALLGARQAFTCDPGYSECSPSSIWCCPTGEKCCSNGHCAKTSEVCCSGGYACYAGQKCCGFLSCAPAQGECCNDGFSCDAGLHCVILNGIHGCCKDLSCSEFDTGSGSDTTVSVTPVSVPSVTFTPISITPLSFTPLSFTPISITPISFTPISITPISFTPISITPLTLPTPAVDYSYFYTTWTYYYYTYFITIIPPSLTTPTSSEVTTRTIFTAYATDSLDANIQFDSITAGITYPTAVTAPGYTKEVADLTSSSSSFTARSTAGEGSASTTSTAVAVAAANGAVKSNDGLGTILLSGCLGIAIGLLAVWL